MTHIPPQDIDKHIRLLVDHVPSMLAYWDANLICRFANKAYKTWFGVEPEQIIGQPMLALLGPKLFELNRVYIEGALNGQEQVFERVVPGKDGVDRHSLANYIPDIENGKVKGFLVQVTEVTQLKQVEAELRESRRQLRSLAASREEALEQERKHIARELHDELGQLMTGLKMDLSVLQLQCAQHPPSLALIASMNGVVERTFEVIRCVATNLRPPVMDIGLVPSLEWLVEDFSLRWDIPCDLKIEGQERELDETRSTVVFRVIQESLTNVARHAQAQHVGVCLTFDGTRVKVTIQDDGVGFSDLKLKDGHGFGLLGMRERLMAIGGQFEVDSQPGSGCTVSVVVPQPGRYLFNTPL